jgi:hypothetical protein
MFKTGKIAQTEVTSIRGLLLWAPAVVLPSFENSLSSELCLTNLVLAVVVKQNESRIKMSKT